jgi:hypothetical protein
MKYLQLAVVLTCALAPPAMAGSARDIADIPRDGTCNDEEFGKIDLPGDIRRGLGYTFVVKSDAHLTINSAVVSEEIDKPLNPLEEATIYGIDPGTEKVLISVRQRALCGWVSGKDDVLLLEKERNGKVKTIDSQLYKDGPRQVMVKDSPFKQGNDQNSLFLKIVVHNTNIHGNEGVPVYETPGGKLSSAEKYFNIYEVYKYETASDPETGIPTRFYLAGWTPAGSGQPRKKLRGWVREADLFPWSTRIAVMWEGSGDALGYATLEKLKAGATADSPFNKERGFGFQNELERKGILPRFPVIDQFPSEGALRDRLGHRPTPAEAEASVEAYKVVVQGEACDGNGQNCISSSQVAAGRGDAGDLIGKLETVDIMFVIDNTKSMDPYRAEVIDAVSEFVRSGLADRGVDIRVAAAVYGDYKGKTARRDELQFTLQVPFSSPESGAINKLSGLEIFKDPQRDMLEAPFAALITAAEVRGWRPNAGIHYIVHIADHGNREWHSKSPDNTSDLIEEVSLDEVVSSFASRNIIYVPIAVLGDSNSPSPYADPARQSHLRQARELTRKMPRSSRELKLTYAERDPKRESGVKEQILNAIKLGTTMSVGARCQVGDKTAAADSSCAEADSDPSIGRIITGILERLGYNEEARNVLSHSQQTVNAYYFSPRTGGKPTFTFWVALESRALDRLIYLSQGACKFVTDSSGFVYIKEDILKATEIEAAEALSPAEAIEKRLFIPASHLSPFMNKEWSAMQKEIEFSSPDHLEAMEKDFCRKATQLTLVQQGAWVEPGALVWNPRDKYTVPNSAKKPFKWIYDTRDGSAFYYVPVSYLP